METLGTAGMNIPYSEAISLNHHTPCLSAMHLPDVLILLFSLEERGREISESSCPRSLDLFRRNLERTA